MSHYELLQRLLPPTSYEPSGPALAGELVADANALDLALISTAQWLLEIDPRTCSAMLLDWERVYGLPDPCIVATGLVQSFAERRAALVALVTMQGGQSPAFFIALALALGYVITITECRPHNTEHDTEHPTYDEQYQFVWFVNSALYNLRELTTEDDTEMATEVWGNTLLECRINRFKPAHTYVIFAYS